MPGPNPKPNRRRTNTPKKLLSHAMLDPEGRKGPIPRPRVELRHDAVKEMWRAWWRSPQATQWDTATSVMPLSRLAGLYDAEMCGEDLKTAHLAAMRQLEDKFGLTPKGMKDLGWEVGKPEGSGGSSGAGNVTQMDRYRAVVASG